MRVVKIALNSAHADIGALLRGHLKLLHRAYAVLWVKDENLSSGDILKSLKRRLARVARGRNEYNYLFAGLAL